MATVQKLTKNQTVAATQPLSSSSSSSSSSLLLIRIVSSCSKDTTFALPASLVQHRETEMQAACVKFGIPSQRWSGSLIYRQWKEQGRTEMVLQPEKECASQNYSHLLRWEPWLTALVQSYYQTGKLQVPSECQGLDLLLMLEYFGIIYQPSQLSFDSTLAYQRVKAWSDYLTVRASVADWVSVAMISQKQPQYHFATSTASEERMELGKKRLSVLDGGLSFSNDSTKSSCLTVYELFNRAEPEGVAAAMREDFCVYLQNMLTNVHVSFPLKPLTVHMDELTMEQKKRAVLMVDVINTNGQTQVAGKPSPPVRTKSDLTYPMDELIEEDLATGRLESLMQQIDARHPSYKGQSRAYTAQFLTMFESTSASSRPNVDTQVKSRQQPPKSAPVAVPKPAEKEPLQPKPVVAAPAPAQSRPVDPSPQTAKAAVSPMLKSPRKVTAVDHIYAELELESNAQFAVETSYHDVLESKECVLRGSSVPPQEVTTREPMYKGVVRTASPILDPIIAAALVYMGEGSAPVNIIHAERHDAHSVTSALTSPNFVDDDVDLRDILEGDIHSEALRQEWIQGNVMNRDIFKRAEELLREESKLTNPDDLEADENSSRRLNSVHERFDSWDWLMDLCQAIAPNSEIKARSPATDQDPLDKSGEEGSNLLADAFCSPTFQLGGPSKDTEPEEKKDSEVVPEERPNLSASAYRGLVKDRMTDFQQHQHHLEKQTRQDSTSKLSRAFRPAARQDCMEDVVKEEGIEVHLEKKSPTRTPSAPASSPARSASQSSAKTPKHPSPPVPTTNRTALQGVTKQTKTPSTPSRKPTTKSSTSTGTPQRKYSTSKKVVGTPTNRSKTKTDTSAASPSTLSSTQSTGINKKKADVEKPRAGFAGLFRRRKGLDV